MGNSLHNKITIGRPSMFQSFGMLKIAAAFTIASAIATICASLATSVV